MKVKISLGLLVVAATILTCQSWSFSQSLDEKEFQRLHAELEPQDEDWKSIPWQTNLLEAQKLAAESQKPIFIWAMDGHPLGCT